MEKLLLIAITLIGLNGYSQKTLEIYNFTTYTVMVFDIATNASGSYPEFHANFGPPNAITLLPGASYTLENTASITRFPFQSPTSVPYIANWIRKTSPTVETNMTSPAAWVLGNAQVFDKMVFRVLDPPGASGGTVGVATPLVTSTNWVAIYDSFTSGTATTYTVVIN